MDVYSNLRKTGFVANYAAGQFLYREGETCRHLYLVERGCVKLVATSAEGREFVMHIIKEGRLFAAGEMLLRSTYQHDAIAMEESIVRSISVEEWERVVSLHPELDKSLALDLARNLQVMSKRLKGLALADTRQRLAMYLYRKILHSDRQEDKVRITLKFSRETLSSIFNTSREHISRELSALARTGIISVKSRTIIVNSTEGLRRIIDP